MTTVDSLGSTLLGYYSQMLLIRRFEEKVSWLFSRALIGGTSHPSVGQEACAVGVSAALEADDYVVSTHRGHGHMLARGSSPQRLMAELMGRRAGYCGGKGGTQHLCDVEHGFLGTNGIVAGGLPIATGVGLALKLSRRPQVVVAFFGDGASNQGAFHESLNMASLWQCNTIFFCENNLYAMSSHVHKTTSVVDISQRAASYGIPGVVVDGMDILAVRDQVIVAAQRARSGGGPTLIEAKTYRFLGHSKNDPRKYRDRAEEDEWQRRDPLLLCAELLRKGGVAASTIADVELEVNAQVEDAVSFAQSSNYGSSEEALGGVYASA